MNKAIKQTIGEQIFSVVNYIIMIILIILMIYPFWHILMYSISEVKLAATGGIFLWPRGLSFETYGVVFRNRSVLTGFQVSLTVTILGTLVSTFFTATTAYPLAKSRLRGKTIITFLIFFTMLFSGGMIPTYLLIKSLGMIDKYTALIIPGAISAWNVFIMRNFFAAIPEALEESARIDGATDLKIFFRIILPLSKPVLAVIALFNAVMYWNDFFSTILYVTSKDMWSLQAVLRELITSTGAAMQRQGVNVINEQRMTTETITMATVVVTTFPILIVYPFAQKYFVQGVMIGSVKG
jgi:putative aldouronate transport system permease protein